VKEGSVTMALWGPINPASSARGLAGKGMGGAREEPDSFKAKGQAPDCRGVQVVSTRTQFHYY
jgi:hypothetical protein